MNADVVLNALIDARMAFLIKGCSYAALFLTLWDWFTTLNFETLIIWNKKTDHRVRWMYCTSRYCGLVAQCTNSFITTFVALTSSRDCRIWHGFQLVIALTLLLSLEITLIFRLHALYNDLPSMNRWLTSGLVLLSIANIVFGAIAIQGLTYSTDGACLPLHAPKSVMYLAITQMISQFVVWGLTLYKYLVVHWQQKFVKIPVLSLITRDGLWVFVMFTALLSAVIGDAARREDKGKASPMCYIIFPIYVALVSLSSCRITMNIRVFAAEVGPRPLSTSNKSVELTTLFSSNEFVDIS